MRFVLKYPWMYMFILYIFLPKNRISFVYALDTSNLRTSKFSENIHHYKNMNFEKKCKKLAFLCKDVWDKAAK